MKRLSVPGVWIPALFLLLSSGWPAYGAHNVYLPLLSKDSVILDPRRIGGEGASILYKGKTYTEPVGVQKSALVGIIQGDQAFLYHPSQGENITLSDTSTKDAFLRFWLGLEEGSQDSAKAIGVEPFSDVVLGDGLGSLPNGGEKTLNTYVKIKRSDPQVTITNTIGRWVAVKINYKESSPKVHYLAPAGRYLDSNIVATLGNLKVISHPLLDDASSPCSITVGESTQITKIETFGAVYRGMSFFAYQKQWPPGAAESWNGPDHNLVLMVNLIDMLHQWIEAVENLAPPVTPACLDFFTGFIINAIEVTFLTHATAEERIMMPYALSLGRDAFYAGIKCWGWAMSGMSLEVLYTFWDIFVAGGYIVTDLILLPMYVKTASAYSFEELYYPPCETTVKPAVNVYVQAKVRGPVKAGVSYKYIKRYCNGAWGEGIIGPYTGTIGNNGIYLAGMLGVFKMENLQDEILVRATVNGTEKQAIVNYGSFGIDGFNLLFPKVVEITFP